MLLQALHKHRRKWTSYPSVLAAMEDPILICASDFHIDYMNPAMAEIIPAENHGAPCHKAVFGLDHPCGWCLHGRVSAGGPIKTEIVNPQNERTYRTLHAPFHNPDGSVSMLTSFRDITPIRALRRRLHHKRTMACTGAITRKIAHDLNNTLFPITGLTEMLLESVPDNRECQQMLKEILSASCRAEYLVEQLLLTTKPLK